MNKFFVSMCVLLTFLNVLSGVTVYSMNNDVEIEISSAYQLAKIGRDDNYPLNGNYILTQDLDFSTISNFKPIGEHSMHIKHCEENSDCFFSGTLNGNGKKIINFNIDYFRDPNFIDAIDVKHTFAGLFSCLVKGAKVFDLEFDSCTLVANKSCIMIGCVAGAVCSGSIVKNVKIQNTEIISRYGAKCVGGIAGKISYDCKCINCGFDGEISVNGNQSYVGGLFGLSTANHISESFSDCKIDSRGSRNLVGGICGQDSKALIEKCLSKGQFKCEGENCFIGGIVGETHSKSKIKNSYSTSSIHSNDKGCYIGGIVGRGLAGSKIKSCYFSGIIISENEDCTAGGIIGDCLFSSCYDSTVVKCLAANTPSIIADKSQSASYIMGKDKKDFKNSFGLKFCENSTFDKSLCLVSFKEIIKDKIFDILEFDETVWDFEVYGLFLPSLKCISRDLQGDMSFGSEDVIKIENVEDLKNVENNLNGIYFLSCDIDAKEQEIILARNDKVFSGILHGNGKKIKNLHLNVMDNYKEIGLFSRTDIDALILDLGLQHCSVNVNGYYNSVGILAGRNNATVENCSIDNCTINIFGSNNSIGGIIGENTGSNNIERCVCECIISGSGSENCVGGVLGKAWNMFCDSKVNLTNCLSYGDIVFSGPKNIVAGVVGECQDCNIKWCKSIMNIWTNGDESTVCGIVSKLVDVNSVLNVSFEGNINVTGDLCKVEEIASSSNQCDYDQIMIRSSAQVFKVDLTCPEHKNIKYNGKEIGFSKSIESQSEDEEESFYEEDLQYD